MPPTRYSPTFQLSVDSDSPDGTVSGTGSNFRIRYTKGINLPDIPGWRWYVSLTQYSYTNSLPNISPNYANNTIQYSTDSGATWKTIVIPTGTYNVDALNTFISNTITYDEGLQVSPVNFSMNGPTQRVVLYINPTSTYGIKFSSPALAQMLGISASQFIPTTAEPAYEGDFIPTFNQGVDMLYVICEGLIDNQTNYRNGYPVPLLKCVPINGPPGAIVSEDIPSPVRCPVVIGPDNQIQELNFRWTDWRGREIDFNGQPTMVTVKFEHKKYGAD